jgi:5-formyltetrahydrofolate cyclo-ligase
MHTQPHTAAGLSVFTRFLFHLLLLVLLPGSARIGTSSYNNMASSAPIADDASSMAFKKQLRTHIKATIKSLAPEYIAAKSADLTSILTEHPYYLASKGICIYISMPGEVETYDLLRAALSISPSKPRVFIPKVTGGNSQDMFMYELTSYSEIETFPKTKWGIPEPPVELLEAATDGTSLGVIDTILVPGMAFDTKCGRMGRGKGYYDCFIERCTTINASFGKPEPKKIGICLDEQMVLEGETVPMAAHDRYMDCIITPTRIITREPQQLDEKVAADEAAPL